MYTRILSNEDHQLFTNGRLVKEDTPLEEPQLRRIRFLYGYFDRRFGLNRPDEPRGRDDTAGIPFFLFLFRFFFFFFLFFRTRLDRPYERGETMARRWRKLYQQKGDDTRETERARGVGG